jgi:tRNA (mo5U34)-methyltransferase
MSAEWTDAMRREVETLGPWFHNIELPSGVQTAPDHPLGSDFPARKWRVIAPHLPERMDGWHVLDIGCNAGFYSVELARRGAHVTAIDSEPHYLRQAEWVARQFGVADRIALRQMQVYDIARMDESFDLVLFMGVFYHLRYPLLALDAVARTVRRTLVFQTLTMPGDEVCSGDIGATDIEDRALMLHPGWPKMAFIEHCFFNDPTNWWAPNHAAVEAMLRSAGMRIVVRPGHEIYVCEPDRGAGAARPWQTTEFHAAVGRYEDDRQAGVA